MTVYAMTTCWGPSFPTNNPQDRLVALALADGLDEATPYTRAVVKALAAKTGLTAEAVTDSLVRLGDLGVITEFGGTLTWRLGR